MGRFHKPHRWAIDIGLLAPEFQRLWRDAIVYPLWRGGGEVFVAYPSKRTNTGSGTFPQWTSGGLFLDRSVPHYQILDPALIVGRDDSEPQYRSYHSIGSVFRCPSGSQANTMYAEGCTTDNDDHCSFQLRQDISGNIRYFYRSGATSGESNDFRAVENFCDDKWHAACVVNATPHSSTPIPMIAADGRIHRVDYSNNPPTGQGGAGKEMMTDQCAIGVHPRSVPAWDEPFEGHLGMIVTWRRALTDAEALLFSRDPYGMIREAQRPVTGIVSAIATYYETLAATAVGSVGIATAGTWFRTLAATVVGVPVITSVASWYRTLAATAVGVPVLTKTMFVSLIATVIGVADIVTVKFAEVALVATAVCVAGLATVATWYRILAAIVVASAAITTVSTWYRTLTATAVGVAGVATQFIAAVLTYVLEGFQFRHDDEDEVNATDIGAQDEDMTAAAAANRRLRILTDIEDGDPDPEGITLQYKRRADPDWRDV